MKLGKTARIFLVSGIVVVLFASLGMTYYQQVKEQSRLTQELSSAELLLVKQLAKYPPEEFSNQKKELEIKLARTGLRLEDVKANLRQSIESIETTDTLFEVAQTFKVEIVAIESPGVTTRDLEWVTYSILSLTATVEGDMPNLIDFIRELSEKFPTGVVESVKIEVPGVLDEEEELARPSAEVLLVIYTYEGD